MPSHPPFVPLTWNEAAIAALGTMSDRAVGKLLNINPKTAQAKRHELNIEPYRLPKRVLEIVCVIDGKKTLVVGKRKSRLRLTCPPEHRITRPGLSDCHKDLIRAVQKITRNQSMSARKLIKKQGGSSMIRLLDD